MFRCSHVGLLVPVDRLMSTALEANWAIRVWSGWRLFPGAVALTWPDRQLGHGLQCSRLHWNAGKG